ncbi:hypothetical protein GCM10023163_20620 [Aestuariibaculum suncheonense]
MSVNILKILFVISASRINKKGLAPLTCRITYLNKRKAISTGFLLTQNTGIVKNRKLFQIPRKTNLSIHN